MSTQYAWELIVENCTGCGICLDVCDFTAIYMPRENAYPEPVPEACTGCLICAEQCPFGAVEVRALEPV